MGNGIERVSMLAANAIAAADNASNPKRKSDCPANGICAVIGNRREACMAGHPKARLDEACLASIVILLAKQAGIQQKTEDSASSLS
jgi:hypothetical protein